MKRVNKSGCTPACFPFLASSVSPAPQQLGNKSGAWLLMLGKWLVVISSWFRHLLPRALPDVCEIQACLMGLLAPASFLEVFKLENCSNQANVL